MGSDTAEICLCHNMSSLNFQLLRTFFPAVFMMLPVRKHISLGKKMYMYLSWPFLLAIYLT